MFQKYIDYRLNFIKYKNLPTFLSLAGLASIFYIVPYTKKAFCATSLSLIFYTISHMTYYAQVISLRKHLDSTHSKQTDIKEDIRMLAYTRLLYIFGLSITMLCVISNLVTSSLIMHQKSVNYILYLFSFYSLCVYAVPLVFSQLISYHEKVGANDNLKAFGCFLLPQLITALFSYCINLIAQSSNFNLNISNRAQYCIYNTIYALSLIVTPASKILSLGEEPVELEYRNAWTIISATLARISLYLLTRNKYYDYMLFAAIDMVLQNIVLAPSLEAVNSSSTSLNDTKLEKEAYQNPIVVTQSSVHQSVMSYINEVAMYCTLGVPLYTV